MLTLFACELAKLRRSLVLLTVLGGPLAAAAFCFLTLLTRELPVAWGDFLKDGMAMWAYLLLPLSITALTVFLAQIEHGPRMWTHMLVIPIRRSTFFGAKIVLALVLVGLMNAALAVLLLAGAALADAIVGPLFANDPQIVPLLALLARIAVAAAAMTVLQLWAALAFRSFVPPLLLGMVGTVAAVAAISARSPVTLPWGLSALQLGDPRMAGAALLVGLAVTCALTLAMLVHMSRREWA